VTRGRAVQQDVSAELEQRLGRLRAQQRVEIEQARELQNLGEGINPVRVPGFYLSDVVIRRFLKLTGLYWRGHRNALEIQVKHHFIKEPLIPKAFDGFTILHLSDLHTDMNQNAMGRLTNILQGISYDICVLTGDYRGKTSGPFESAIAGMMQIQASLKKPIYGVLGDHDTIRMVPALEEMGIRMLLNESETITRGNQIIHLAGIDDAHRHQADNIEEAACGIPHGEFSILLSHTPEIYRQAAHADFKLLLSGHTHGGQICLPGGIPVTLASVLPRRMGSGPWNYQGMIGYTSAGAGSSIVPVRFNCPPEITLHHLQSVPNLHGR
jgi:uncharacterized protein